MTVVTATSELPVARAKAGDESAWDTLFRRYQLPLYTFVRELVGDDQTALDIVQESFISAIRHVAGLRDDRRFGSWLFAIAHQKCRHHWRSDRPMDTLEDACGEEIPDDEPGPGEWLVRREDEAAVLDAVQRLPVDQRSALLLQALEGFSLEQIAEIAGVPVGTVKSRLHHARRAVREMMENLP